MNARANYFYYLFLLFFICCNTNRSSVAKINFHIHHAYGQKVYLQTIAFGKEKGKTVDSAIIKSGDDVITFKLPNAEERPYKIRTREIPAEFFFINDKPDLTIEANILKPDEYKIENSPATISVKNFLNEQVKLIIQNRSKVGQIDSSKAKGVSKTIIDSLSHQSNRDMFAFFQRYINYADTVASPGAFLYIYNNIDFGNNYTELKKFILKASDRFPGSKLIQHLKDETLDFVKTFEIEYNIGDHLPELQLPDQEGNQFSISSLSGKYVFMDFWSTWCEVCLKYDEAKKIAKKTFPPDKFEIVSIALDAEKDAWKQYIHSKNYNWVQLIDEKMWNGPTNKAYRIDSIPFNFLLAPDGRILSKAIKPDSVVIMISKVIK